MNNFKMLELREEKGKRETIRQTIFAYEKIDGDTKKILDKYKWYDLACGIHDEEKTIKYMKDIIKVGDYVTRLGNN